MAVKVGDSWVSEAALAYAKGKVNSEAEDTLDELSKQYPEINFSTNIEPFSQKGVKNIQIAPNILNQMKNDPEKRLEYEALIYDCATGIDMLNRSGGGFHTKAAGFIINPDGSLGAWSISESDNGGTKRKNRFKLDKNKKETWAETIRKKQLEKRKKAKKEEQIQNKKRAEEKTLEEQNQSFQSEDGAVTLELSKEAMAAQEKEKETSESHGTKVGFNEGKRARQLAAAKTTENVQVVMLLLQKDLADCEAGLQQGACDENEVNKVKAMIAKAQQRLGEVSSEGESNEADENAFAMSMLM